MVRGASLTRNLAMAENATIQSYCGAGMLCVAENAAIQSLIALD